MPGFIATARQREPVVKAAFSLALTSSDGRIVNEAPMFQHALTVARTLGTHCPDAPGYVVAALLLHHAVDETGGAEGLDQRIIGAVGQRTFDFVRQLHGEREVSGDPRSTAATGYLSVLTTVPWLADAALAGKIVTLAHVTRLSQRAANEEEFWLKRSDFLARIPYLHLLEDATVDVTPPAMSLAYGQLLAACSESAGAWARHAGSVRKSKQHV